MELDIEGEEGNLPRLDNFWQVASESYIFPAASISEYTETAPEEDKTSRS